jgi:hypothetical protein
MSRFIVEEESGTFVGGRMRQHNGYWAGNPPASSMTILQAWFEWGDTRATRSPACPLAADRSAKTELP